jgi:hypothetical protein
MVPHHTVQSAQLVLDCESDLFLFPLCRQSVGAKEPNRRPMTVDELTIDEIAQSLSLSREAVKGRLHLARGLIREYLTG